MNWQTASKPDKTDVFSGRWEAELLRSVSTAGYRSRMEYGSYSYCIYPDPVPTLYLDRELGRTLSINTRV